MPHVSGRRLSGAQFSFASASWLRADSPVSGGLTAQLHLRTFVMGPSPTHLSARSILRWQAVGFSALVAVMWIVEVFRLPHLLFGESAEFILARPIMRTLTVLAVWALVHFSTKRLLRRLHELEEFLLICAWCRKVGDGDRWLSLEDYFDSKFATGTSHGICPECAVKQLEAHRQRTCAAVEKSTPDA